MVKIGVIGAGTWGIALARLLANIGHDVTVWSALPEEIDEMSATRRHKNLPNMIIPDTLALTKDGSTVCEGKDILLFAVPSVFVRSTAGKLAPFIPDGQIIVDVAKGIEPNTLLTMTQVIKDELLNTPGHENIRLVALSGPTHAEEVAMDLPATIVSACSDLRTAQKVQDVFMNTYMRVYTNPDVEGIELCGAVKNVMALAAGISSGLGYGDNTRAALITRGMAEITRLGTAMGCNVQTFSGLAGIGDLIVTATSQHSRNNRCGFLIGKGMSPADAISEVGMVVEGINALPATIELSRRYGVEMPIVNAVNDVVNNGADPHDAVMSLMNRGKKAETGDTEQILMSGKEEELKRVITYGTFDRLNYEHINLLKRAKALGDYLVVVLAEDRFAQDELNIKCVQTYEQRKALLESLRYVDLVVPETSREQKKSDIHEYRINTLCMSAEHEGEYDSLRDEGIEVVYLPDETDSAE